MARFLILDAYAARGRERLVSGGAPLAGDMYREMLLRHRPDAECDIFYVADPNTHLPQPLESYDAMLWTGSSLTIYDDVPEVTQQIELARRAYQMGVPAYGSCWALHLAVVAAGGTCQRSPHGLTFGPTYDITLTPEGEAHPVFQTRQSGFEALASHYDIVKTLPSGAKPLAQSPRSQVQAVFIEHEKGSFFATQYHPEFDFSVLHGMLQSRLDTLVEQGFYADPRAAETQAAEFARLAEATPPEDLIAKYRLTDNVLIAEQRHTEFRNWLDLLAL
jgi:GMP synthase (glutamine-hydrolysing)